MELGKGKKLDEIIKELGMVAEGIDTCDSVYNLARKLNIEMPITSELYNIIYNNKPLLQAIKDITQRKLKEERC